MHLLFKAVDTRHVIFIALRKIRLQVSKKRGGGERLKGCSPSIEAHVCTWDRHNLLVYDKSLV